MIRFFMRHWIRIAPRGALAGRRAKSLGPSDVRQIQRQFSIEAVYNTVSPRFFALRFCFFIFPGTDLGNV